MRLWRPRCFVTFKSLESSRMFFLTLLLLYHTPLGITLFSFGFLKCFIILHGSALLCVCVCTYSHIHIRYICYMYTHIVTYICILCMYELSHIFVYTTYVHINLYIHISWHIHKYVVYIKSYILYTTYVCMYMSGNIYIQIYIYIYI